ncbi:MAG: hypothetical protein K2X97_07995 [Mycobacteriaceae bacterium]|nr:hypothetical protein [Mycobacteriaceae bacterium]
MRSAVGAQAHSVWTPGDFADESLWSFELSPADRHALIITAGGAKPATWQTISGRLRNNGPNC